MKKIKLTLTLLIILFSACEKTDTPNLPVHGSGRIVICKVDGVPWSHGVGWCPMCHSLETDYYSDSKQLFFSAANFLEDPFNNYLNIYIYVDSVGLTSFNWSGPTYSDFNHPDGCNSSKYYPDTLYNNQFYIEEFDPEKKKIRGTFDFQVINYKCQDTVLITDGYFDLNPYWH